MLQSVCDACDVEDGALTEGRRLLIDRHARYSDEATRA
jgi:hypothetical protein